MDDKAKLDLILSKVEGIEVCQKQQGKQIADMETKFVKAGSALSTLKWVGGIIVAVGLFGLEGLLKLKIW